MFLDQFIHFGKNLRDQVKDRSPKKVKSLIEVPYVAHLKIQVVRFNMIQIYYPNRVPRPSYPFRENQREKGKCRPPKKLKAWIKLL